MLHLYSVKWGLETYTGDVVVGAYSFLKQSIPNLPSEYGGTLTLVRGDFRDHFGGGHSRFGTAYCTRSYRTRLVVPKTEKKQSETKITILANQRKNCRDFNTQQHKILHQPNIPAKDLGHASVGDLQNPGYIARTRSWMGQFHDFLPGGIGQGTSADEHTS